MTHDIKIKYRIIVIAIFLSAVTSVRAQIKRKTISPDDVIIEGSVSDSTVILAPGKKISVTLRISTFPANAIVAPAVKYVAEVDSNRHFKLVIPSPANRFYMRISYSPIGKYHWSTFVDNIYILEKGDRIYCRLSNITFEFSGKGAAKLNCQSAIYKHQFQSTKQEQELLNAGEWDKAMSFYNYRQDSILKIRLNLVKENEHSLGREMTNILIANCYGLRYYASLRSSRAPLGRQRFMAFVNSDGYKSINRVFKKNIDTSSLIASPNYVDFLFEHILVNDLKGTNGNADTTGGNFRRIYTKIRSDYSGKIREKLLITYFLNYKINSAALAFLDDALTLVKSADYKEILTEIKRTKSKSSPFYPFELEDDKGKIVRLSDFKVKVVFIDFWFTGCSPCKMLNESMKPVLAKFKDNPNVKFVSVSIDADKSRWLKSVASGEYTHPTSINLYAGGKHSSTDKVHPLISNYNITAYPTVFLLKNGKIYEMGPPRPSPSDENNPEKGNTQQLISLINKAIVEKE